MNLTEHSARVARLIDTVRENQAEKVLMPAAQVMLARIKRRIQKDGRNSFGGAIGRYSTKPLYASRKQFVKQGSFTPRGKTGTGDFKNGRRRRSMYMPQGIRQLRQVQGLESGQVNVTYSGDMIDQYQALQAGRKVFLGMRTKEAAKKRGYVEEKYGPILTASREEFAAYKADVAKGFIDQTTAALTGHV